MERAAARRFLSTLALDALSLGPAFARPHNRSLTHPWSRSQSNATPSFCDPPGPPARPRPRGFPSSPTSLQHCDCHSTDGTDTTWEKTQEGNDPGQRRNRDTCLDTRVSAPIGLPQIISDLQAQRAHMPHRSAEGSIPSIPEIPESRFASFWRGQNVPGTAPSCSLKRLPREPIVRGEGPEHALLQSVGARWIRNTPSREARTTGVFSMLWRSTRTKYSVRTNTVCLPLRIQIRPSPLPPSRPRSSIFPETAPEKIGRTRTPGLAQPGWDDGDPVRRLGHRNLARQASTDPILPSPPSLVSALGRTPAARSPQLAHPMRHGGVEHGAEPDLAHQGAPSNQRRKHPAGVLGVWSGPCVCCPSVVIGENGCSLIVSVLFRPNQTGPCPNQHQQSES